VDELVGAAVRRGLLEGAVLTRLVEDVRAGRRHMRAVWHLLVLEAWLQRHIDGR
jgi:hypothetical protein